MLLLEYRLQKTDSRSSPEIVSEILFLSFHLSEKVKQVTLEYITEFLQISDKDYSFLVCLKAA